MVAAVVCRGRGLEEGEKTLDGNSGLAEAKMDQSLLSEAVTVAGLTNDTYQHITNYPG